MPGSYTRIGDPIVTILNDDDLEIEADIPTVRALTLAPAFELRADCKMVFSSMPRPGGYPTGKYATRTLPAHYRDSAKNQ